MKKNLFAFATALTAAALFAQPATAQKGNGGSSAWDINGNTNTTVNSRLGTNNSVPLRLVTKGIERLRIDTFGNVGIGTFSPSTNLDVVGNGQFSLGLSVLDSGIKVKNSFGHGIEVTGGPTGVLSKATYDGGKGVMGIAYEFSNVGPVGNVGVYGTGYYGVYGNSINGYAIRGESEKGLAVSGVSWNSIGVLGASQEATAIYGTTSGITAYAGYFKSSKYRGIYAEAPWNSYAGYFAGNVYATGVYTSSDGKLKKNVQSIGAALDIIKKLEPKQYEFRNDGSYAHLRLPQGQHYGLIAQDVENILPDLVKESGVDNKNMKLPKDFESVNEQNQAVDFKAVNYIELIPILIKGMQEQQQKIEELEEKLKNSTPEKNIKSLTGELTSASLSQNVPNPAQSSTRISYSIPAGVRGQLVVSDVTGKTLKSFSIDSSGAIDLNISGMNSGVYNYSLIVNGKTVDTKRLTIVH